MLGKKKFVAHCLRVDWCSLTKLQQAPPLKGLQLQMYHPQQGNFNPSCKSAIKQLISFVLQLKEEHKFFQDSLDWLVEFMLMKFFNSNQNKVSSNCRRFDHSAAKRRQFDDTFDVKFWLELKKLHKHE